MQEDQRACGPGCQCINCGNLHASNPPGLASQGGWLNFESPTSSSSSSCRFLTRFLRCRCLTLQLFNPFHAFTVNSLHAYMYMHVQMCVAS